MKCTETFVGFPTSCSLSYFVANCSAYLLPWWNAANASNTQATEKIKLTYFTYLFKCSRDPWWT